MSLVRNFFIAGTAGAALLGISSATSATSDLQPEPIKLTPEYLPSPDKPFEAPEPILEPAAHPLADYTIVPSIIDGSYTVGSVKHKVKIQLDSGKDGSASISGKLAKPFECTKYTPPEDQAPEATRLKKSDYPGQFVDNEGINQYVCNEAMVSVLFENAKGEFGNPMKLEVSDITVIKLRDNEGHETSKTEIRPIVKIPKIGFGGLVFKDVEADITDRGDFGEELLIGAKFLSTHKIIPLPAGDNKEVAQVVPVRDLLLEAPIVTYKANYTMGEQKNAPAPANP